MGEDSPVARKPLVVRRPCLSREADAGCRTLQKGGIRTSPARGPLRFCRLSSYGTPGLVEAAWIEATGESPASLRRY